MLLRDSSVWPYIQFCASLIILPEELPGAGPELVVEEAVDDDVERAVGHQQEAVHRRHHLKIIFYNILGLKL